MPAITCSELLTSCATEGRTMPVVVMRLMYARSAVENARSVVTGAAVSVGSVMAEGTVRGLKPAGRAADYTTGAHRAARNRP